MKLFFLRNVAVLSFFLFFLMPYQGMSQCLTGETELVLSIETDNWGSECYWQITPQGNNCDQGMIAEGGNINQVGCNGGGGQDATGGQGYGDNMTTTENGICLNIGASYTLHYVDDYNDGGANFIFSLFGYPMYEYTGPNAGGSFDFVVQEPMDYEVEGLQVLSYSYLPPMNNIIRGEFFNNGSAVITSVEFSYSINNGSSVQGNISGLNIPPYTSFVLDHPTLWNPTANGDYDISLWVSLINDNQDMFTANDIISANVIVGPGIPNIIDDYAGFNIDLEQIAGFSEGINHPRDLDFHPILSRNELWVVLKSNEDSGGETVKITNAGEPGQNELQQQDGNAWHFMSLPTGIAFSENENFATSPGVFDANHDGGEPFTGPTLWDSDPLVYAQPSGGNGSHIDMLHESPYSMGIAHEIDNKFWVTCGAHNEIMSFDFQVDHGPGNSDHSDGVVYKYTITGYNEDADHEVPDHLVFDKNSGWLYICNSQQNRIIRINTTTGTPGDDETPHEALSVFKYMDNFDWEVYISSGLDGPTGIDIIEDRLIVSNYNSGDIQIYDISGSSPILLNTIPTDEAGIMGVKIGPDGHIWYVNSITNEVVRVNTAGVSVEEKNTSHSLNVFPNPANGFVRVSVTQLLQLEKAEITICDLSGRVLLRQNIGSNHSARVDVSSIATGVYMLQLSDVNGTIDSKKLVIE